MNLENKKKTQMSLFLCVHLLGLALSIYSDNLVMIFIDIWIKI